MREISVSLFSTGLSHILYHYTKYIKVNACINNENFCVYRLSCCIFYWDHSNLCSLTKSLFSLFQVSLTLYTIPILFALFTSCSSLCLYFRGGWQACQSLTHLHTLIVLPIHIYTTQTCLIINSNTFSLDILYQRRLITVNLRTKKIRPSINHDSLSMIALEDLLITSASTSRWPRRLGPQLR